MYAQSFFTTSDRGIGPFPTTASKSAESFNGFMKAEFAFAGITFVLRPSFGFKPSLRRKLILNGVYTLIVAYLPL